MKGKKLIVQLFLATVIIITAIFQVLILNKESTEGEKLTVMIKEIEEIKLDNSRLMQKIASASSIATISSKAKDYGLINNQISVSLNTPLPIALLRSTL